MPTIQPALDESCVWPARSIKMFYEGREAEGESYLPKSQANQGQNKGETHLGSLQRLRQECLLGDCKMGACLGKGHGTPTPRGAKQSRQKPLLVYSADRKSFFSQGTFFTKKLGVVPGQGQGIIFIIS